MDSFSCIIIPLTIAFRLEYVLVYQFYPKITFFDQEKFGTAPYTFMSKPLAETNVKKTSRHQK